jgi:hypothetical protein
MLDVASVIENGSGWTWKVDECKPLQPGTAPGRARDAEAQPGAGGDHAAARWAAEGCGSPGRRHGHGRAVLVEPMKPVLTAPAFMLLDLRYDGPLSHPALSFNMRRYTMVIVRQPPSGAAAKRSRSAMAGEGRCTAIPMPGWATGRG